MRQRDLYVNDDKDLVVPALVFNGDLVVPGSLDRSTEPVTRGIEGLAVEQPVGQRVGADAELDGPCDEAFDLVDVEALVHPRDQQRLGPLGLGPDLPLLPRLHLLRADE